MERPEVETFDNNNNIIVCKFQCTQNDNEIKLVHVDGDINQGEFHFGNVDAGSHYVIGLKDMMDCLKQLELVREISYESQP